MSPELIARMAAEAPNLRVVKLEEEPTAPKVGRLLAANPSLRVLGGLGGEMLIEELRRGAVGTMTGFGYPEALVAIMRDWRAGNEAAAVERFHRWMPLIRFENRGAGHHGSRCIGDPALDIAACFLRRGNERYGKNHKQDGKFAAAIEARHFLLLMETTLMGDGLHCQALI